jgi:hypothetical protein
MNMKIAYCGNFEPRHSTETHIARTLTEELGHDVIRLQENVMSVDDMLRIILSQQCDLFLYTRTWGFIGDGMAFLDTLRKMGVPSASYHLDLYWGIQREKTVEGDPFWRTDYVFTPDGGSDERFKQAGINHFYVKPGVFGKECVDGSLNPKFKADVGFVGALDSYHPEWLPYRQELKSFLVKSYPLFRHWPGNEPAVRNEDLNDLYASVDVIVGDSLCMNFNHPYYWSDRVYETIGRGGFLIMPYIKGLEEEFVDGETITFFNYNDWAGLKEKIDYYLANPTEREKIRTAGQAFVRENATYKQRLTQALEIVFS